MSKFKIIAVLLFGIISVSAFASTRFVVVQCNMSPVASSTASYSDPTTGLKVTANSCGEALLHVPSDYQLLSESSGGVETAAFVNYLFSK